MKTENLILITLDGLIATAIEKKCVFENAQEDLKQIRDMYVDLVQFWGLDADLINEFDMQVGRVK